MKHLEVKHGIALSLSCQLAASLACPSELAQDPLPKDANKILHFTFEERTRGEEKAGVNSGNSVNRPHMLRGVAELHPLPWLRTSGNHVRPELDSCLTDTYSLHFVWAATKKGAAASQQLDAQSRSLMTLLEQLEAMAGSATN